jgi:WD40-like Beta Propeller Repeat
MDAKFSKSEATSTVRKLRVTVAVLAAVVLAVAVYAVVDAFSGSGTDSAAGNASSPAPSTTSLARSAETPRPGSSSRGRKPVSKGARSVSIAEPRVLVAVTSGGTLETVDPATGSPTSTLATGVTGDEVSISPDSSMVYFESAVGCLHEIERVPVSGGNPDVVASGSVPALSPDGSELAYVRQPQGNDGPCAGQTGSASSYELVVRQVATGAETTYPVAPQLSGSPPDPVDHLSWSADGKQLAVSMGANSAGTGWQLAIFDPASDNYYFTGSGVAVTGNDSSASYYREGVFMPDGNLFVNRVCCEGTDAVTSNLLLEVDPSGGSILHQVAIGILANDHTSLDVDSSGEWLLYLSGDALFVSKAGNRPTLLTTGLSAAAW